MGKEASDLPKEVIEQTVSETIDKSKAAEASTIYGPNSSSIGDEIASNAIDESTKTS